MSVRDEHETIRKYLLGQLTGPQCDQFEERFFTDDELFEELQAGEEELIDDFLTGDLSQTDLAMFHQNFLVGAERQQQLRLGKGLREYAHNNKFETEFKPQPVISLKRLFSSYSLRVAAVAAVLAIASVGIWRVLFVESEVDKALVALNSAYRQQRPLESRITQFEYAPFVTTRGPGSEVTDQNELNRAELALLEALRKNPTAATRHALGNVYLSKKEFDRAIALFDEALKGDPSNARIFADRGAAWLEKGKVNLDRGKDARDDAAGQGMEEVGRSLVDLNRALELDSALLAARFNKALAEQYIHLYSQAEQDWNEYLKRDATSPWAEEARRNLKLLQERKNKTANTNEQLIGDFIKAYEARDDDAAWASLKLSRSRTGNKIVEVLLTDFVNFSKAGDRAAADQKLKTLQYAGLLEERKIQDRYTSELVSGYAGATPEQLGMRSNARAVMQTAIGFYNKAEWTKAIELFNESRDLFRSSNDSVEVLFAEAFAGYSYLRIPDTQTALETFGRLSRIFEARNYRSMYAQSVLALADAMNGRNEFSKMLDLAAESLVVSQQVEDYANTVRCLQAQTSVQLIFGDYRKSLTAAFQAMTIASNLPPDAKLMWPLYHEAASDFYLLGMPGVALEFETEAVHVALGARIPFLASRAFDRLALIQQRLGNVAEAKNNGDLAREQGLSIADERSRTNVLAHSAMNFGRLYRESGELQKAIASFDEALGLYEKLNLDIYQYQARKGKLLALIKLQDAAAEEELKTVLFWFEKNREKISEESYRNKFFDTDQDTYEVAVDFYQSRRDAGTAFNYAEAYRARSLWELMNTTAQMTDDATNPEIKLSASATPLTLTQIQQQLSADTQLLEYAVLEDKVLMWVVTKDSLKSARTEIKRSELDGIINEYLAILSRPNPSVEEARTRAKDLYTKLVTPIEGSLDRNRLVAIIPDDKLSFLPFASLVSPTTGKYLIEDFTIQTSPSAGIFVAAAARPRQDELNKPERLLVVGNPTFSRQQFQHLPDLPAAAREANEIAKLYGAAPLSGIEATSARVKRDLVNVDVVHLATHALADDRSPLLSKLVLSSGGPASGEAHHSSPGFIQASEIYRMKLPRTRLVVLSACRTGIERAYRGEGAIGLARPFIAAGVPVVIASLWPVESESAADLMISFHKHRKQKNLSAAQALRLAQLEILHNQQPISNYGWAAFTAIGGYAGF